MGGNSAGPALLTIPEAAGELRLSRRSVENLISEGRLTKVKIGRSARVLGQSLAAYVNELAAEAAEQAR